ncbi:MAG: DUF6261 family protein [Tannerellaceae bacterium]|jgi:hypothetical protein|nr:DUF6261 family protein [Tannerellaceae bacterium]
MTLITSFLALVRRLRNAEHFDLFERFASFFRGKTLHPVSLAPFCVTFLQSFDKEDLIYKRYLRKEDTMFVKDQHEKRKVAYMSLKRTAELGAYSDNAQLVAASESIMRVINNYSDAYYAPMTEATAQILNMIQDLKLPKYASAITLLGASDAIERLNTENEAFKDLYTNRALEWEGEKSEGSLTNARTQTEQDFSRLAEAINISYAFNEMQRPKDPVVSAFLSECILFINSYIHQYEAIYARRNPKYRPGKEDNKPGIPGEDLPGYNLPEFIVSSQAIVGSSSDGSSAGTHMSLAVTDAVAFAAALYPIAKDGVVRILNPENDTYEDLPVSDFLFDTDGTTPVGLLVAPPAANVFFDKPFQGFGDIQTVDVIKDEETLATLTGVKYPYTIINN